MGNNTLTLVNSSALTSFGDYSYRAVSLEEAKALLLDYRSEGKTVHSAIGHESTAALLTTLLGFPVTVNRMSYRQDVGDIALVFKVKERTAEGKILGVDEISATQCEFGLLVRMG